MDEKADQKMQIHQLLVKNGFYRLPMQTLSEIIRLLEMSESVDPKGIQQNTIGGLLKTIEKLRHGAGNQGAKYAQHLNQNKFEKIPKDIKEYVLLLLEQTNQVVNNKYQMNPNSSMMAPMPPSMQGIPSPMYPPMYNPMAQMPYAGRPMGNGESSNAEGSRYMDEAMRMQQQMYLYYYSLYQNGYNPMMNPQMGGMNSFMNPYTNGYGLMPGQNKGMSSGPNGAMPYGQMNPMARNQMPELPPPPQIPPQPPTNPYASQASNNMANASTSQQQKLREQLSGMNVSSNVSKTANKQEPKRTKRQYHKRSTQHNLDYNRPPPTTMEKLTEKKKVDPSIDQGTKMTPQNQPFIIGGRADKPVIKQPSRSLSEPNSLLKSCACRGYQRHEDTFLCSICNRTFHFYCLNEPLRRAGESKQNIECYHCRMRFIDPLNKVKEVIIEQYITNIMDNKFTISVNLKPFEHLVKSKKNEIEMRCLKVSHLENNQITWPDECVIKLNGERIIEIPALQLNSSLKKRKDYSIIVTQNIYNKNTEGDKSNLQKIKLSLEIKNLSKEQLIHKKIRNNVTFAFAIYFIEKLSVDELYDKIINEEKMEEVPNYISKLMKTSQKQVQINKISISIYDPYTWDLIKMPVRGSKCQHGQCFDLRTFISFMMAARNRSWKCPVCNKDARKFMIDTQQLDIIKRVMEGNCIPTEITFMKQGNIVLKIQKESDNEEGDSAAKNQKSKKIMKSPKRQKTEKDIERPLKKAVSSEQAKKLQQSIEIDLDDQDEVPAVQLQHNEQNKDKREVPPPLVAKEVRPDQPDMKDEAQDKKGPEPQNTKKDGQIQEGRIENKGQGDNQQSQKKQ